MNLFNNEEYYKHAVEVFWTLRTIVLEEIKIDYGIGRSMSYDTQHPNYWIAEITNEIIGRTMIDGYTYSTIYSNSWIVGKPRSSESGFLTYNEAEFIAGIAEDDNLMNELYRLRLSVSQYTEGENTPIYNIYKVVNDLIEALTGRKILCA